MLFRDEPQRVTSAIRRDPMDGTDVLTSAILEFADGISTFTCSTRTETDQRVHVYGTTGRIAVAIPFNIPPDVPTTISVTSGGDPPVAPATEVITFDVKDPYAAQAEAFARVVLDGEPTPLPASDAVANLRVIEAIFAAAAEPTGSAG
jgi:predicted dehydrogenase